MNTASGSKEVTTRPTVSKESFRNGMAKLAGAVNIVTTDGPDGWAGFTASAVCSVTDTPATLLVCLNRASSAATSFLASSSLCVNTLGPTHKELAMAFGGGTPMRDRFAKSDWHPGIDGAPHLDGATVAFDCRITARQEIGTHQVMFCEVIDVNERQDASALVWFDRSCRVLSPA